MEALLIIAFAAVVFPLILGAIAVLKEPENNWPWVGKIKLYE